MPKPIALCLEHLSGAPQSSRHTTCVAIRGGAPGLAIDRHGQVVWLRPEPVACELWVSLDEKLILLRPTGAPEVVVQRSGRSLSVPGAKPVVLLDQDEFRAAGKRFRVHVHGVAHAVSPPAPLFERRAVRTLAVTLAIGAAALGCDKKPIDVRETPPAPPRASNRRAVGRLRCAWLRPARRESTGRCAIGRIRVGGWGGRGGGCGVGHGQGGCERAGETAADRDPSPSTFAATTRSA